MYLDSMNLPSIQKKKKKKKKYPKTRIKEIYGECLCVSERPYKIYPPCFRVLHEGDEYMK